MWLIELIRIIKKATQKMKCVVHLIWLIQHMSWGCFIATGCRRENRPCYHDTSYSCSFLTSTRECCLTFFLQNRSNLIKNWKSESNTFVSVGDKTPPTADDQPSPVIATFFAFTMFMVMLSVVATVLNLFMHHRNVVLQDVMAPWMLTVCK